MLACGVLKEGYSKNKLVKLIVDIGRHDYPQHWPSFFQDTFQLNSISPSIGLMLTKTIVEEFYSSRQDISTTQSTTIRAALNSNICEILNGVVLYNLQNGYNALSGASPVSDSPLFSSQKSPTETHYPSPTSLVPLTSFEYKQNSKTAFEILQQLITVSANQDLFWTSNCINVLLKYALVDPNDYEWTYLVIQCLDELFSKPTISLGATSFLPAIMDKMCAILSNHLHLFRSDQIDILPDGYTTKLIDLLDHLISNHLDSFKVMNKLKLQQLLVQMCHFTYSLSKADDATHLMTVWESLIETTGATFPELESLFLELVEGLIQERRFQSDGEIDVSRMILDVCTMVATQYTSSTTHLLLGKYYKRTEDIHLIFSQGWNPHIAPTITELSLIVLGIGRLAIFCEDNFQTNFATTMQLLEHQLSLISSLISFPIPDPVFYLLMGNIFESFNMYMNWIAIYQTVSINSTENSSKCQIFITSIIDIALKATILFPQQHCLPGSRVLSIATSRLRPDLENSASVSQFLLKLQSGVPTDNMGVCSNIWKFVTNYFVYFPQGYKPGPEDWCSRARRFQQYLDPILQTIPKFYQLNMAATNKQELRQKLLYTFQIIESVSLATNEGQLQTRELSFQALAGVFSFLPTFLDVFKADSEGICKVTELMIIIIHVFKKQLSNSQLNHIVPQTLKWCQSYILESQAENERMEMQCFKLFDMLIEDKSKLFDNALPNMINFCVELHSKVVLDAGSEKISHLYGLIDRILYYHWNYFFSSKVQQLKGGSQAHPEEFTSLFQV
jgi:hypothetical protein